MRIEYLREFVVFAKHLNFSAASKELMMTQPGLSNHVKALEDEVGVVLVNRRSPVQLTAAGRIFLAGAQRVLFDYDDVLGKTRASVGPRVIKIQGSLPGEGLIADSRLLEDFTLVYVNADLHESILDNVKRGEVDLVTLAGEPPSEMIQAIESDSNLAIVNAGPDRLSLVVERTNPLSNKAVLSKEDLQSTDIVIFSGAFFDIWKNELSQIIGEDVSLHFRLDPMRKLDDIDVADLMGSIYICQSGLISKHFQDRDDIVVFDKVDGKPLICDTQFVYDVRNKQAREFVARFEGEAEDMPVIGSYKHPL